MIMAPLLSNIILDFGWRTGYVIAGITFLVVVVPASLPIHRAPELRGLYPDGKPPPPNKAEGQGSETNGTAEVDFSVKEALRTFNYWLLASCIALRILVTVALSAHLVPIMVWKGMDEATGAYMVGLMASGTILTSLAMGWMGDQWNKARLCCAGILPVAANMLGLVFSEASSILYAFPIAVSIAQGTVPLNWALIGDFFGRRSYAPLRGMMGLSNGIVTFLSPVYAGWIFDLTGSYSIVLITFSIVLMISASLFGVLRRPSPLKGKS